MGENARRALKRWKDQHGLDPNNKEHVAAFQLCQHTHQRVSAAMVLAVLEEAEVKNEKGVTMETPFYLVPKKNFTGDLPAAVKEYMLTEGELRKEYDVPEDSDFSAVWIVDQAAERTALGTRVVVVRFKDSTTIQMKHKRGMPIIAKPVAEEDTGSPQKDTAGAASSSEKPTQAPTTAAAAPASSSAAAAPADTDSAPELAPPSKRAKVLKMMNSDETVEGKTEEQEAAVLEKVIRKIKAGCHITYGN